MAGKNPEGQARQKEASVQGNDDDGVGSQERQVVVLMHYLDQFQCSNIIMGVNGEILNG